MPPARPPASRAASGQAQADVAPDLRTSTGSSLRTKEHTLRYVSIAMSLALLVTWLCSLQLGSLWNVRSARIWGAVLRHFSDTASPELAVVGVEHTTSLEAAGLTSPATTLAPVDHQPFSSTSVFHPAAADTPLSPSSPGATPTTTVGASPAAGYSHLFNTSAASNFAASTNVSNTTIPVFSQHKGLSPPQIKRCRIGASGRQYNGKPLFNAIFLAWSDPAITHKVAFELRPEKGRQFLGATTSVSSIGIAEITVTSLEAGEAGLASLPPLLLSGRALDRRGGEGEPKHWSKAAAQGVRCEVLLDGFLEETATTDRNLPSAAPSHWIQLYRFSLEGQQPDFLQNHNAADIIGTGWHLHLVGSGRRLWARYCVEVMNVSMDGVTTNWAEGGLNGEPFADYQSCEKGWCHCGGISDRSVGRQPVATGIYKACTNAKVHVKCKCSELSEEQSRNHIGKVRIKLPFVRYAPPMNLAMVYPPIDENCTTEGGWYSLPGRAECGSKQRIGENCTWHRKASYEISYFDYFKGVRKRKHGTSGGIMIGTETMLHNAQMMREAYARAPLRPLPCGEG